MKEKRDGSWKLKRRLPQVVRGKELADKKRAMEVIGKLVRWRAENGLSQRQAAAVMAARDYGVNLRTLQSWETGRKLPEGLVVKALEIFLSEYPRVDDAPVYRKVSRFSSGDLAEIRRLRAEGATMAAIGERYGVDQSYISRILSAERLAKAAA